MQRSSLARLTVMAAALSLTLTACGERGGSTGGDGGGSNGKKVVKIGVIAPLSGDLSALGLGIQHSVELAAKQANEAGTIPGWTVEVVPMDDEAKPEVGANAATKLTSDKDVAGVVGTLNSNVSQQVQPILAKANIVQVSPANTGPSLSRGADFATAPKRQYPTYFRTCTTDDVQGPFAATYLYEKAGIKEVATIHDKKTYGQGLVEAFTKKFEELGGKVVAAETINPDDSQFSSVVSAVKSKSPKAVYYGGEYPQAGPLSQQMKSAGLAVPLMGGDGIYDPKYIELAGAKSDGDLASSVGAPVESLESAKAFVEAYDKAGYKDPYAAYGAYSYDAGKAIIEALKTSLDGADSVEGAREKTIEALGKVSFDGATGKVGFDEYGDSTSRVLTTYEVKGGAWTPAFTQDFQK